MATSMGITGNAAGAVDWLTGKWLDYQRIKHNVDIESTSDGRNVPDRVDIEAGVGSTQSGLGGGSAPVRFSLGPWGMLGLGAVAVLGVGLYASRRKRKG